MKVKELKKQLENVDENLEIQIYDTFNDWYLDLNIVHVDNLFGKDTFILVTD